MKKLIPLRWTLWLLSVNATIAVLFIGCATPQQHSFNQDFGQSLPTRPMYYIHDEDDKHFLITVHQGTPSPLPERTINVKEAATGVAQAECQRLGWEKWKMDYIQERDQGWMHIVIAEVTREPYITPTFPQTTNNP
jgi:hypothetical protein